MARKLSTTALIFFFVSFHLCACSTNPNSLALPAKELIDEKCSHYINTKESLNRFKPLADCYMDEDSNLYDPDTALYWYTRALDNGEQYVSEMVIYLNLFYLNDIDATKPYITTNVNSTEPLANYASFLTKIEKDTTAAITHLRAARNMGYPPAVAQEIHFMKTGYCGVHMDLESATQLTRFLNYAVAYAHLKQGQSNNTNLAATRKGFSTLYKAFNNKNNHHFLSIKMTLQANDLWIENCSNHFSQPIYSFNKDTFLHLEKFMHCKNLYHQQKSTLESCLKY